MLVLGGAGFIGSHLVEALVNQNAAVTVVDDLSSGYLHNLGAVADAIEFYAMSIDDAGFRALLVSKGFDTIFHFAGTAYVPPSVKDPVADCQANLGMTLHLLECLRQEALQPRLIYASSAAVYGDPVRQPIHENDPTVPISPYGVSKLAADRYVAVYSRLYGIPAASLRLFSVYGPRQKKQIVYDFLRKLDANSEEMIILGDGSQRRDLILVSDVVQAAIKVASKGALKGEVYNVASGKSYSTLDIARVMAEVMGVSPAFKFTGQVRPGDPHEWSANIHRLLALGFEPVCTLEAGLTMTAEWFRANGRLWT